jgi:4-alpha-glucanotransferase
MQTAEFREFYVANEEWLRPYAIFCFLRDLFGTAEHWHWGVLARPTPEVRRRESAVRLCCSQLTAALWRTTGLTHS